MLWTHQTKIPKKCIGSMSVIFFYVLHQDIE